MTTTLKLTLVGKGDPAVPTELEIQVNGAPDLRTTLRIETVQQMRDALDVLLGPHAAPDLAALVREMFEVHDRPCQPNGDWDHATEYRAREARVRKLVGAPDRVYP